MPDYTKAIPGLVSPDRNKPAAEPAPPAPAETRENPEENPAEAE